MRSRCDSKYACTAAAADSAREYGSMALVGTQRSPSGPRKPRTEYGLAASAIGSKLGISRPSFVPAARNSASESSTARALTPSAVTCNDHCTPSMKLRPAAAIFIASNKPPPTAPLAIATLARVLMASLKPTRGAFWLLRGSRPIIRPGSRNRLQATMPRISAANES